MEPPTFAAETRTDYLFRLSYERVLLSVSEKFKSIFISPHRSPEQRTKHTELVKEIKNLLLNSLIRYTSSEMGPKSALIRLVKL